MLTPLRVLIIEDSEIDADLIRYHLGKAGFELTWERVETAEEMQAALKSQSWDIIISDYNLPGFSAPAALTLLQQSQQDIPFIIDSGTISEETALDLMRAGAADYLMKDRLARLGALVRRELNISQIRRERQAAQIALNQSENRLQTIFQATPTIILQIDRDGTVLWINRISPNRSREEVIGKSIYRILSPEEQAKMKSTLAAMIGDHHPVVYESQITRSDGDIVWYENHVSPVIEGGRVISFIYNSINVTDRKQAEIALQKSRMVVKEEELYLRTILQTTMDGFWMLDNRGKVLDANQAYCQMSGYSLQELKQFSISDLDAVEDSATTQARIKRIQESGAEQFETRHRRKNGSVFDAEISVTYLSEYGGRFICFCRDISERKRNETQLINRMNALTRPLDQLEDFDFQAMFDLKAIQKLQDEFSAATGIASIITYPDGTPITQPSNFCRLCRDIIRKTEKGQINCFKSDAAIGRANLEGPMIQPCMSGGLWDAGAGISVGGRHIANWLIGQVRDETQHEEDIRAYARQIGVDETEAVCAFREVPSMSQKQFQQVAQVLFTMANQLSTAAYQNLQQARYIAERQQVEQELARWAQIFQHAEWGIVIGSIDGKSMELINPAFAKMHGYAVEELNGWSIADLFTPECRADVPRNIQLAHQKGHHVWESRHIHKNGSTFPVLIDVTAVSEDNGQVKYRIVNVQDITQRKQAEKDLRQSEEMFRSISENSFEMIALLDTKGYFQYCNSAYHRILGYSQEDLIGHDGFEIVHPDERAGLYQLFQDALADPILAQKISNERILNRIRSVDGSYKLIEHRYRDLRDEQGNIVHILLNAQDITERKNVEDDLRLSEEKFSTAFRISPDAININRLKDGLYIEVNEGFSALTGYKVEEVIGKTSLEINIWNDPQDRVRLVQGLRNYGQVTNLEASFRIKDGSIRVCLMSARIIDINGEQCILSITRDITERNRAQKIVQESEARQKTMISNISDVIGIMDTQATILYKSPNIEKWFGWKPEDLIGTDGWKTVYPDDLERIQNEFKQLLDHPNEPKTVQYRYLCKDGEYKWIELTAANLANDPLINGILMNYHDISGRRRAEAALQESEFFFKETQRAGSIGSYKTDFTTGYWESSEVLDQIFGIDQSYDRNVPGWLEIVHPEDRGMMERYLRDEVIGNRKPFDKDYRIIRKSDQSTRWVHGLGEVDFDPYGNVLSLIGTIQDITERKQAELLQRFNTERVQALLKLNQMTDATLQQITQYALEEAVRLTQSKIGYLAFMNEDESVLTMHAWSNQAMQDCEIQDKPIVFKLEDIGLWGEAVRQRQPIITNDYAASNSLKRGVPKGHIRIDRHMNVPIFVGNRIVLVAGVGNKDLDYEDNDVQQLRLLMDGMWRLIERLKSEEELARHREHLEDQVVQRTAQLSAANQELEAFSYSVSHDLRAPLRALDGFSEILLSDYAGLLDDQGQNYLRRIQEASRRMGELINDLLHLSHITRTELSIQRVNLSALAQEISIELQAHHPDHCPVNWEISADLVVEGDANLLKIALENLLNNAFKFTSQREIAQIAFGLAEQLGQNTYFIRDNGAGFNMEYAEKLFAPFQRLHSGKEFPGTGIGLSIVQRVISRHGGCIWPESEVGRGTTFYFTVNRTL